MVLDPIVTPPPSDAPSLKINVAPLPDASPKGMRDTLTDLLLVKVATKDVNAFEDIYNRFSRPMFSMAVRITHSRDDAEDVLQEAFLQVWTHADRYRPELGSAFHWICSLVRHKSIDRLRATRRHLLNADTEPANLPDNSALGVSPLHSLTFDDARRQAVAALKRLSPEERKVIELAFFGAQTHGQIALALRLPVGTVKARIRRGLFKLRPVLSLKTAA